MFQELHKLDEKEKSAIKSAVSKSGGRVMVVVHPLWEGTTQALINLKKIAVAKGTAPMILFETSDGLTRTREALKKISSSVKTRQIVLVRTKSDDSKPLRGWKKIISALEDIGAKKVFIAGQTLTFCHASLFKGYGPAEAVAAKQKRRVQDRFAKWSSSLGLSSATFTGGKVKALERGAAMVPLGCVGGAYNELLLSGKFEGVHIMPGLSLPSRLERLVRREE